MQIRNSLVEEAVKEFLNRRPYVKIARRRGLILYGDATGNTQTNRQTGLTDFEALTQELERNDLWGSIGQKQVGIANPERIARYAAGNRMLEDSTGKIGVVMNEGTTEPLVIDLERMFYKPGTRNVEIPKYKDGRPTKLFTHLADAFSYPIAQDFPVRVIESAEPTTSR